MSITLHMLNKDAPVARDPLDFSLPLAPTASQTNAVFARYSPLFPFLIVGVRLYGSSFTNVTSIDIGMAPTAGGTFTTALSAQITPSADAEVAGALTTTLANLRGTATSQLICRYTTGTGPQAVNSFVSIVIRPRPMDGDPTI